MNEVHLGYEVGTGAPVSIPVAHTCVVGQTQCSGKTTTLEAMVSRIHNCTALAFVTKRGEANFTTSVNNIHPYFRDRADWQFVDQLLEAQLREKNKFLRPWLMRICRNTKTLADVHQAVKKALSKAKGLNESVYTQLDAYLSLIVPEIGKARLAENLRLASGLNVMRLESYQTPMQMLFIQSAIDWINEKESSTITIVPESWEFIPEGKGSPVKDSAVTLVRKGAALRNFIYVDSQDTAGVSKVILRGCTVWLLGVQREANEIKRNLSNIPAGIAKPKPADIAQLDKGQFFACWKDKVVRTYVQPAWMTREDAAAIARGARSRLSVSPPRQTEWGGVSPQFVVIDECPELPESDMTSLESKIDMLLERMGAVAFPPSPPIAGGDCNQPISTQAVHIPVVPVPDKQLPLQRLGYGDRSMDEELYQQFKARLIKEIPAVLHLILQKPELQVEVERVVIKADGDSMQGRLAQMIHSGFFEKPVSGGLVQKDLAHRGLKVSPGSLYPALKNLATLGFLTITEGIDGSGRKRDEYQAVQGMKVNIVKK